MKKKYIAIIVMVTLGVLSCGGETKPIENTTTQETTVTSTEETEKVVEEIAATQYPAGEEIYNAKCKACHQAMGQGIKSVFPPLANSDYLLADKNRAIKQIIEGSSEEMIVNGETYNGTMTPQNLEDQEIVDVMNYILNSWGNDGGTVTLEDVQNQK